MKHRIEQLNKYAQNIKMKDKVRFFDSHEEYVEELKKGKIKSHHICLINDVPETDE